MYPFYMHMLLSIPPDHYIKHTTLISEKCYKPKQVPCTVFSKIFATISHENPNPAIRAKNYNTTNKKCTILDNSPIGIVDSEVF